MGEYSKFIVELNRKNREYYGDEHRGPGSLSVLPHAFKHYWHYLPELIQNALDARARTVRVETPSDGELVFEHDGHPFTEADVRSLCLVGSTNKGIGSLGFMGIGFKAVFRCYERVEVSSGGWRFYLEASVGGANPNLLGTVLPIEDERLPGPSESMNCRFALRKRTAGLGSSAEDVDRIFKKERVLRALLARHGIVRLEVRGEALELRAETLSKLNRVQPYGVLATMSAEEGASEAAGHWIIFSAEYPPSEAARAAYLAHRATSAAWLSPKDRKRFRECFAELVCPAVRNERGQLLPSPHGQGRAFAVLPTSVQLPMALDLQADWLLVTDRQDYIDPRDSPWHRDIFAQLPNLLVAYLCQIGRVEWTDPHALRGAYEALPDLADARESCGGYFASEELKGGLREALERIRCLPGVFDGKIRFHPPAKGRALPLELAGLDDPAALPWRLFGADLVCADWLGAAREGFFDRLGLLRPIGPEELVARWERDAVQSWYGALGGEGPGRLLTLLQGLSKLDETAEWKHAELRCLPTVAGTWVCRAEITHRLPDEWPELPPELATWLESALEEPEHTLAGSCEQLLRAERQAQGYVGGKQLELGALLSRWWESLGESDEDLHRTIAVTRWVKEHRPKRAELVGRVVCTDGARPMLRPPQEAVLLFGADYRGRFFVGVPAIVEDYLEGDGGGEEREEWRLFFERSRELRGRFRLDLHHRELTRAELEREAPGQTPPACSSMTETVVESCWGVSFRRDRYLLVDWVLPVDVAEVVRDEHAITDLLAWMDEGRDELVANHKRRLRYYRRSVCDGPGDWGECSWVATLRNTRWMLSRDGRIERPARIAGEECAASARLVLALEQCGIRFGTELKAGVIVQPSRAAEQSPEYRPLRGMREYSDGAQRIAVMEYEKERGRYPVARSESHGEWDLETFAYQPSDPRHDPSRPLRRIEVKGNAGAWDGTATVSMTRAQFLKALNSGPDDPEYWLYVVDGNGDVWPLRNPAAQALEFELPAGIWRRSAALVAPASEPKVERRAEMIRKVSLASAVGGQLFVHSMPGRYESLAQVTAWLREAGIERIYSLADLDEIAKKSPDYRKAIDGGELQPVIFPIADYGVPASTEAFLGLAHGVAAELQAGRHVLVHCAGGHGRTGILTRLVLLALGSTAEEAESTARAAGTAAETEEQRQLVARCAGELADGRDVAPR